MNTNTKRGLIALVLAALIAVGIASVAQGATEHTVRKASFIASLSDTRDTGYYGFGPKGLVLDTTDSTGQAKVAEYYAASGGLPDSASQDWVGSNPEPGKQIVFNSGTAGDSGYNILVGEPVYGSDWWMSTGSYIYKNHHELCPETTGGSGSDCHGTLAEWQDAFSDAAVSAYGFSLGSGVKGDGVLKSQTFGDDKYTFSDTAAGAPAQTTAAVTAQAPTFDGSQNRQFIGHFRTDACPANDTCRGAKARVEVKVNGSTRYQNSMGWGEYVGLRLLFSKDGGDRNVTVYVNDTLVGSRSITTD